MSLIEALSRYPLLSTDLPHKAGHFFDEFFGANTLSPRSIDLTGAAEDYEFHVHGVRLNDICVLAVQTNTDTTWQIGNQSDRYVVHQSPGGTIAVQDSTRPSKLSVDQAWIMNPQESLRIELSAGVPLLCVLIRAEAMHRHLVRMMGRSPARALHFEHEFDLTGEAAMRWHGVMQLLSTELHFSGALVHATAGANSLEEFLMCSLLQLQESSHCQDVSDAANTHERRITRAARRYVELHLGSDITVEELAQHVGSSPRTLQVAFREDLNTTPMSYVRNRRLERAHELLQQASPQRDLSVTQVAQEVGFHHLSSFANLYRKRWGESPSDTLRA